MQDIKQQVLDYHQQEKPGKIQIIPSKPCQTIKDLSLAYTPGVAYPCQKIQQQPLLAYDYTSKGNLVAVVSNGTAVLGLGDIGPLAGKPVMEGKAVLFKRFAGVDAIDLEIAENDPHKLANIIASLEPTFGGINLEDIKAPECFMVEKELINRMNIPVFHDDQHGTAIVVSAALSNALELVHKKFETIKLVFSGAGAAAIACANLLIELGVKRSNIFMFDSKGLLTTARKDLNEYKKKFAQEENYSLQGALTGADVFIGVSKGNLLTGNDLKLMNCMPIVLAMANPTPEIAYDVAKEAVPDIIMATGRSDYPNQVNNVLCFPFLFRGALDVHAKTINLEMKKAAIKTLASLAKKKVHSSVTKACSKNFSFCSEYILPKIFDSRLLPEMSTAVAKAAMDSGVARKTIDLKEYKKTLRKMALKLARGKFV